VCGAGIVGTAHGRVFDEARVAAPFLKIGQGARAAGMGEAFTAVADDPTAVFWNPAGLAQVNDVEVMFTHNQWIENFRHEYFGITVPFEGTWSAAYSLLDLGQFALLDPETRVLGDTFSVNDQVFQLGYARAFASDAVLAGASAKLVKEDLGSGIRGQTVSFSGGIMGIPLWEQPRVALAAVVENMGGELSGFPMPATARVGISWRQSGLLASPAEAVASGIEEPGKRGTAAYPWQTEEIADSLTLAADVVAPARGRMEFHAGLEYWLSFAALRAGYRFRYPRNDLGGMSGLTLGLGLRGRGFQFDYGFDASYAPYGDLGNASRFAVIVTF
jgi:hypothetical protein